jgi:hypothetical protein
MRLHYLLFLFHVLCVGLFGQTQPKPSTPPAVATPPVVTAPPAGVTVSEPSYPLPLEQRDKFRDLQHENDSIEIENQKMLVKIEENKARQALIVDQEMAIASQFGREKNLDLLQYELDPAPIALKKKKAVK